MLRYQYHCACCNKVVSSNQKACDDCGSHNIRSPFGFWILCILSCLIAAILVKSIHLYMTSPQEVPNHHALFSVLHPQSNNNTAKTP
jgi:uncharacterized membrane protein